MLDYTMEFLVSFVSCQYAQCHMLCKGGWRSSRDLRLLLRSWSLTLSFAPSLTHTSCFCAAEAVTKYVESSRYSKLAPQVHRHTRQDYGLTDSSSAWSAPSLARSASAQVQDKTGTEKQAEGDTMLAGDALRHIDALDLIKDDFILVGSLPLHCFFARLLLSGGAHGRSHCQAGMWCPTLNWRRF